jgi:hypothetical protein
MAILDILKSIKPDQFGITKDGDLALRQKDMTGLLTERYIGGRRRVTRIPAASVLTLFSAPVTVMPAAPAGFAWILERAAFRKLAGTAYAGVAAGEDLVIKYTNASGAQVSTVVETTGFLDQATEQVRYANPPGTTGATVGDITPVAGAALVAHLLVGDITTGTGDVYVEIKADLMRVAFTK